jgi:hypothetical protein
MYPITLIKCISNHVRRSKQLIGIITNNMYNPRLKAVSLYHREPYNRSSLCGVEYNTYEKSFLKRAPCLYYAGNLPYENFKIELNLNVELGEDEIRKWDITNARVKDRIDENLEGKTKAEGKVIMSAMK